MKEETCYYNLYLMGKKEPYEISEEEGVKLTELIANGWRNKLLILNGGDLIINISSFSHLSREVEMRDEINSWDGRVIGQTEVRRELTEEEKLARQKYIQLKEKLYNSNKMLSFEERTKAIEEASKEERKLKSNNWQK